MTWESIRSRLTTSWWLIPVGIFVLTRILDSTLLASLIGLQTGSTFTGTHLMTVVSEPRTYLNGLANWDGQWYQSIAQHGYPSTLPTSHGAVVENEWAFYPLLPALARAVMVTGLSFPVAATLVSLLCGLAASCLLYRMMSRFGGRFTASLAVLGLCMSPAALVLGLAYTESLALLLILGAAAALGRHRYGLFVLCTLLLAFTRPISLPLAALCGLHGLIRWRRRATEPFPTTDRVKVVAAAGIAAASFGLWPLVAAVTTGRFDAYFATQQAWAHSDGSDGSWPSWLMMTLHLDSLTAVAVTVGVLVAAVLMIRQREARVWGDELRIWTVIYPLYLLASTRQTSSIIRYLMLTITPGWPLPNLSERARSLRTRVALVALVVVIGAIAQYFWIKYFYVFWPHYGSAP